MVAVEAVVSQLLKKLADPLIALYDVDDKVELLVIQFREMQCFLKDADAKQEGNERVKNWVLNVRDAAYEAEDVIDNFIFKVARLKRTGFMGCITRYACIFCELIARYKLSSDIERINNKFRVISESRSALGIKDISQEAPGTSSAGPSLREWRLTSPLSQEPDIVGFEKDLEFLVERLTKGESRRCVVSVVGMGGLGKTTLTMKVYNDTRVKARFHFRGWICLSQEYDVKDVLKKFINGNLRLSEEESKKVEKKDVFQLRHQISEYLRGKRYLVVVDDIWSNEAWDALKDGFPHVSNGSRVMLTTRKKDIALHADAASQPHDLQFLNSEESWQLFCKKVFLGGDGSCRQRFETLGREIVENCYGLPLAIIVIGGLLSGREPWEWENVRKSINWQLTTEQALVSRILSLSYKDLPYYLKSCFLYLGSFPEDYEFQTKDLIRLWTAEGLLEERGEETFEAVGEDYLQELVRRSLVQVTSRRSSGRIKSCRIHDLWRDLSISKAREGKFLEVHRGNVNNRPASGARRLAIHNNDLSEYTSFSCFTSHLRSVLIYTQSDTWLQREQERFLYGGFKLLRVLHLHGVIIEKLDSQIGKLIHLRYLSCSDSYLESFPSFIGKLTNLQTLSLDSLDVEITLPSKFLKMQQLRHLQVGSVGDSIYLGWEGRWRVIEGHPRLEQISNLQTLPCILAGKWMHGCLGKLTNLRKLGICLDGKGTYDKVLYESIIKMDCLQSLLVVTRCPFPMSVPFKRLSKLKKLRLEGTLEKLPKFRDFPTNLSKLTLALSFLDQDPMVTLEKLENLQILRLFGNAYWGKKMACTAKGFPRLEFLHLKELGQLEEWKVEKGALPSLLRLQIFMCQYLKMLPEGLQHVTTLEELELEHMPVEFNNRLRKDEGEDWHKIRHIPSININDWSVGDSIYLGWGERWEVIEEHPRLEQISNLQTLQCVLAGKWMHGCLGKFANLRNFGICLDGEGTYDKVLYESIIKMDCLQSLLVVTRCPFPMSVPFKHLSKLKKLHLEGTLEKLPESREFSTYLSKLTLALAFLDQDPMATLEKLENLRILILLGNAYWGKEMACTAKGFPRLEFLHLEELGQLEEWRVAKGALPSLLHLRIFNCQFLKMLPEGLQHVTTLKKLELRDMPAEFNERFRNEDGEDWHKIRHIPSINLNKWSTWHEGSNWSVGEGSNWSVADSIYLGWGERWEVIEEHPRLEQISNLQTLKCVLAGKWMHGCLGKLTNLRKFGICLDGEGTYDEVLYESIIKMDCLQSLLVVTRCPFPMSVPFKHLSKLKKLRLEGTLEKLPESREFPTNLSKLTLALSFLDQDPMATLEKLENLRILRLFGNAYWGKEMACTAKGFPRLEFLHLEELGQLEEWKVAEGALPSLLHLRIFNCQFLKMLPEGLQHVTSLKKLELDYMPDEFEERLRNDEGEDWHKIQHVPSINIW